MYIAPSVRQAVLDSFHNKKKGLSTAILNHKEIKYRFENSEQAIQSLITELQAIASFLDQTNPVDHPDETYTDQVLAVAKE